MSSVPTLGYFECRGIAQPIRYLLRYAGVPFNDKRYQFGQGSTAAEIKEHWNKDKYNLGLDFPNIPYYIEGDLKLTQSLAIFRHLARKHGLMGRDERTLARQEMIEQQLKDILSGLMHLVHDKDYEQKKQEYIKDRLIPQLEEMTKFLGSNDWLSTDLSYVDFMAYEVIDRLRLFTPQTIKKFSTLEQYLNRFENLKPIKEYQNSSDFVNWPISGPFSHWGYKK